jgi:hypothetical protein
MDARLVRARWARVRDRGSRLATVASTADLTAVALAPHWYGPSVAGAAVGIGYGALWSLTLPPGRTRDAAAALYTVPSISLAAWLTTERLLPAHSWWELLVDAAWGLVLWRTRPARLAKRLTGREPALLPPVEVVVAAPLVPQHPMAQWWDQRVAIDGGPAPDTALQDVTQTGPASLRAVIRSTIPGTPVPAISILHLSALLNWPEDQITITPVRGRGAGLRQLTIGYAPETEQDPYQHWATVIAPKGMPGTVLTRIRTVTRESELES